MPEYTPEFLREMMDERDRLYTERHESVRREMDTVFEAHKLALEKAHEAVEAKQDLLFVKLHEMGELNLDMERRIGMLEAGRSQDSGRREPITGVVKWLGAVLVTLLAWALGAAHLFAK